MDPARSRDSPRPALPWAEIPPGRGGMCSGWNGIPTSSNRRSLASFLLASSNGVNVARSTILSIVLTLAIGPGVALVCRASCDPEVAAANGCHHDTDGGVSGVSSPASCHDAAPGPAAVRTETAQRGAGVDSSGVLIPAASFRFALATSSRRPARGTDIGSACGTRSRSIPLRI